jgi:hypothetical protein
MPGYQPVKDPLGRVPLPARSIKISPHKPLPRLRPRRGHHPAAHLVLRRSRLDSPPVREPQRIAAHNPALDIDCMLTSHHTNQSGCGETSLSTPILPHRHTGGVRRTHGSSADQQVESELTYKTRPVAAGLLPLTLALRGPIGVRQDPTARRCACARGRERGSDARVWGSLPSQRATG